MGADRALSDNPVVLFDGVCNLCNNAVLFIIKRDAQAKLKFASLQSDYGVSQIKRLAMSSTAGNSVLFIKDGRLYQKSDAALQIARMLDGVWPGLYVFIIVPRFMRDWLYDKIADNRYQWFGKKEECMIPPLALKGRFID